MEAVALAVDATAAVVAVMVLDEVVMAQAAEEGRRLTAWAGTSLATVQAVEAVAMEVDATALVAVEVEVVMAQAEVMELAAGRTSSADNISVGVGGGQFVIPFGAVCYPFGISAYQRCIRNPDTSLMYQKKYFVSGVYQRCIRKIFLIHP